MHTYLLILFSTMVIFSVAYRFLLILAYSSVEEAQKYKESLRETKYWWLAKSMDVMDGLGGCRLIVGVIGLVGVTLTILTWGDQ